jgi:two-component system chemotaxis response regulator CheY
LEAEEAERAWQVCWLMPVDLVIADVNMPGTNGIGFVRQLRSADRPNLKQLPVILLTGDKSEELQNEGLRAGASAFVHKPISNTALVALVEKLLQDESDPPRR